MCTVYDVANDDFWRRDHFDWAQEVECEILRKRNELEDPSTHITESAGHLRTPTHQSEYNTSSGDEQDNQYTWFDDSISECSYHDPLLEDNLNTRVFDDDQIRILDDDDLDYDLDYDLDDQLYCPPLFYSSTTLTGMSQTIVEQSSLKTLGNALSFDFTRREACLTDSTYEFAWRDNSMREFPLIHHFNWLGEGIFQRSAALPEESLAVIISDVKVPRAARNYRVHAILNRAYRYVDPVIVCLDDEVDSSLLALRGSSLQQAAKHHCFRYYTSHGQWLFDTQEPTDEHTLDTGNVDSYLNPSVVIGNGFIKSSFFRSRADFHTIHADTIAAVSPTFPTRKSRWKPTSSSLWQSESTELDATVEINSISELDFTTDVRDTTEPDTTSEAINIPSTGTESEIQSTFAGSTHRHPSPTVRSSISRPEQADQSAHTPTSNLVHQSEVDPSRDPHVYYTFPSSIWGESKIKRRLRKIREFILSRLRITQRTR